MHARLMSHLLGQNKLQGQVRAGRGSQVEILNSAYWGDSPSNSMS